MSKRNSGVGKKERTHSRKTKKRVEIKRQMLEKKASVKTKHK